MQELTIKEIAYRINKIAENNCCPFSKLQEIRRHYKDRTRSRSPFAEFSINADYAFHAGGRAEFQFNIGIDSLNDKTIFRYGLAFSLTRDKTIRNIVEVFNVQIDRFNTFLKRNPSYFKGYEMWYYSNHQLAGNHDKVVAIDDKMFNENNFIFIGKYFTKHIGGLSDKNLISIVDSFDYLMPLYEFVQFGKKENEKRIARLCWNEYGWVMPSGRHGKSKQKNMFEAKFGFGHEEWLFDRSKLINGF